MVMMEVVVVSDGGGSGCLVSGDCGGAGGRYITLLIVSL